MRSSQDIKRDVELELKCDPQIHDTDIAVAVKGGGDAHCPRYRPAAQCGYRAHNIVARLRSKLAFPRPTSRSSSRTAAFMKSATASRLLAFLLATSVPTLAPAQQTQQPSGQTTQSSTSQTQPTGNSQDQSQSNRVPLAGEIPLGITVAETVIVQRGFRASKLLKADVYNDHNDKIGQVDDFVVQTDGKLTTAIIDVGGFLGIGSHRVAIPLSQFSKISTKRIVLPGASKDELKKLPEFKYLQ